MIIQGLIPSVPPTAVDNVRERRLEWDRGEHAGVAPAFFAPYLGAVLLAGRFCNAGPGRKSVSPLRREKNWALPLFSRLWSLVMCPASH